MKLTKVKTAKDVKLEGITTELVFGDGSIKRMILKDKAGNYMEFSVENYSVHAYIPAPPETKDAWKVTGILAGIKLEELFDNEYEAQNKFSELERKSVDNVVKEKISVLVEE